MGYYEHKDQTMMQYVMTWDDKNICLKTNKI